MSPWGVLRSVGHGLAVRGSGPGLVGWGVSFSCHPFVCLIALQNQKIPRRHKLFPKMKKSMYEELRSNHEKIYRTCLISLLVHFV